MRLIDNVSVQLVDISALWNQFPAGFDPTMVPNEQLRLCDLGYRQMCRFFWKTLFELPETANVSSYMRIDSDSCIGNVNSSPFNQLRGRVVYVANTNKYERPSVTRGLRDFVEDYVTYFHVVCKGKWRWRRAFIGPWVAHYYNNLEVLDLNFWRRPDVQHFVAFVDASWGIYLYRWGDSPLRYIALALFAEPGQVVFRPLEWSYQHPCR
jgi:mannosyltransferase